ncbi:MAG: transposase domain-containing protein [Pseudomonadaceae bacterium]|nr:transposase domain-containing protein [Pseudomonadaceae bacterium]
MTFGRKKSKSDACTGIGFFMRRARALELTHNIASTPNSISGLDSLLDPALVEQALEHAGVATLRKRRLPLEMMLPGQRPQVAGPSPSELGRRGCTAGLPSDSEKLV